MKNTQSDRLDALLNDTPGILARTAAVQWQPRGRSASHCWPHDELQSSAG